MADALLGPRRTVVRSAILAPGVLLMYSPGSISATGPQRHHAILHQALAPFETTAPDYGRDSAVSVGHQLLE
jgi:hypothetical protein